MNGRVYDPLLGRFLSADPNIDGVGDAQGYNRYSYVGNNPLGATDPSGYFSLKDVVMIVAIVVVGIITAGAALAALAPGGFSLLGGISTLFSGTLGLGQAIAAGVGFGFGSSFAGSLLNGGSIGDAFKAGIIGGLEGGVSGGLTFGIGNISGSLGYLGTAVAHGVVQGGLTEATGGEFRHGFYAGFATAAASPGIDLIPGSSAGAIAERVAAAAVVGGTASAIGGGKFANGAVSGAFIRLFNEEAHQNFKPKSLDDLKSRMGWKKGEAIAFTGQRPLAGMKDMYFRNGVSDAANLEILHEQVFMIDEAGTLQNVGFFGSGASSGGGVGPDSVSKFTDYTFNKDAIFWRSSPELNPDQNLQYLRLSQTRTDWNWTIEQLSPMFTTRYNVCSCNCQDFAAAFRITSQNWK